MQPPQLNIASTVGGISNNRNQSRGRTVTNNNAPDVHRFSKSPQQRGILKNKNVIYSSIKKYRLIEIIVSVDIYNNKQ